MSTFGGALNEKAFPNGKAFSFNIIVPGREVYPEILSDIETESRLLFYYEAMNNPQTGFYVKEIDTRWIQF